MLIAPHELFGSLIAISVQKKFKTASPVWIYSVSFVLAFFSHFLLDAIPHWHYANEHTTGKELFVRLLCDFVAGGTLIMFFGGGLSEGFISFWRRRLLFLAAFSAILPDFIVELAKRLKLKSGLLGNFLSFHELMHTRMEVSTTIGILTQLVVMVVSCVGLYWFTSRNPG